MSNICDELRSSILQAALQGKLSKQLPEDGTAEELLDKIRNKKTTLNKKVRPLTDEDRLFAVPDTWEWVKFGEIVNFDMGKTPPRADSSYWGNDIPWVSIADMSENDVLLNTKEKISNKALKEKFNSTIVPKGTLIMSFKLTVGRCSILGIDAVHNEAIISIKPVVDDNFIFRDYLARALPFLSNYGDTKEAIKGKTLNSDSLNNLSIPLPPLAEQKRIIKKVDELMARVANLEQSADALASLKKAFPDDIKASLLQYAMQGKLTEQLPEDGNADDLLEEIKAEKEKLVTEGKIKKQKALAPIADDEIPFSIPENWKWVRLGDVGMTNIGLTYSPKNISKNGGTIVLRSSNIQNGKMNYRDIVSVNMEVPRNKMCDKGDILICARNGSKRLVGKAAIVDRDGMSFGAFMAIFKSKCNNYIFYALNSPVFRERVLGGVSTTTINQITQDALANAIIPLPPLPEQKRIVKRLDILMQNINAVGELIASE